MENAEPFYYITEREMSTKVIRMMAPWLAQGKLEILSENTPGMDALAMTALSPNCRTAAATVRLLTLWGYSLAQKNMGL